MNEMSQMTSNLVNSNLHYNTVETRRIASTVQADNESGGGGGGDHNRWLPRVLLSPCHCVTSLVETLYNKVHKNRISYIGILLSVVKTQYKTKQTDFIGTRENPQIGNIYKD